MSKKKFGGLGQYIGTVGALLILCVILTIVSDTFLTYNNIMSILKQTTFTALTAAGMLLCLITAGIDLSVGVNAIFCACMVGMLLNKGVDNAFLLIIVPLIAGTAIGLINGLLLTRLHLPHPFGYEKLSVGRSSAGNRFPDGFRFPEFCYVAGYRDHRRFPDRLYRCYCYLCYHAYPADPHSAGPFHLLCRR